MKAPKGSTHNQINAGVFFSAVIQGRDVTVNLPPQITPAMVGLPAASKSFTGRDDALKTVLGSLSGEDAPAASAVTVVTGMGGVGKTELALQAAHTALGKGWFPGGVLFVDLFGHDPGRRMEPGQVLEGFLRALGISGEHVPYHEQDRARMYASVLAAYAEQGRRVLVVIDNASGHAQVRPLLPADGYCRAIVTSRDALGMIEGRVVDLDVLGVGDSVELLRLALRIRRPEDSRIQDHPGDAEAIARLCAGLPLALRTVAALLGDDPSRPLMSLASDLRDERTRLEELSYGDISVRAALDLSYRRLDDDPASLFTLLPVNPGPDISTAAVAALARVGIVQARRGLEALARSHLIQHGSGSGRWRMHDLVRLFAGQLGTDPEKAFSRLLEHYLTTAQSADACLNHTGDRSAASGFAGRDEALAWLEAEYPNLAAVTVAAVARTVDAPAGWSLSVLLADFLASRRYFNDWIALATAIRQTACANGNPQGEAAAVSYLAAALRGARRPGEAVAECRRAAEICARVHDRPGEAAALVNLGGALSEHGSHDEAAAACRRAAGLYRKAGDRDGQCAALTVLGYALASAQRMNEAIAVYERALGLFRGPDVRHGADPALVRPVIEIWSTRVSTIRNVRDARIFQDTGEDAAQVVRRRGGRHGEAMLLSGLGEALRTAGDAEKAVSMMRRALGLNQEAGDPQSEAVNSHNLAVFLWEMQRYEESADPAKRAARIFRCIGDRYGEGAALTQLGTSLGMAGRLDESLAVLSDARQILHELGDLHGEAMAWNNTGVILRNNGRLIQSLKAFRQWSELNHYLARGIKPGPARSKVHFTMGIE